MSDYLLEQLGEVRADVADLKRQRVTYRMATVTAVDPVMSTFDADVNGAGLLEGIAAEPAFMPAVGDEVRLSLSGATPVYQPHRIGEGAVGEDELAPAVGALIDTALATANGKNKQTFSADPAPVSGLGGEVEGDLWWQYDNDVLTAGWRWNGTAYVTHTFGDAMFDTVNAGKITTGVLAAGVSITVGDPVGNRVVIDGAGGISRFVVGYDLPTVSIPGGSGNNAYFTVTEPATGDALANIDNTGKISGIEVSAETLFVGGVPILPSAATSEGARLVEYGGQYVDSGASTTGEVGIFEVDADLDAARIYSIETTTIALNGTAGALGRLRLRMTDDGTTPTVSNSTIMATVGATVGTDLQGAAVRRIHHPPASGLHRFLLTVARTGGTTGSVWAEGSPEFPIQMWIYDLGQYRGNNAVANNGGGTASTVKRTYTTRYYATWSGTYNGSALDTFYGNEMKQGQYGGDFRGLVGFNSTQIMADLSGATVEACQGYFYANHWYYNSGGSAKITTHGNSSRPSVWTANPTIRWIQSGWPKPGGRLIDFGTAVGDEFKAGTTKGFAFGPAASTSLLYYGRFNGAGMASPPYVEIRYSK